MGPLTKLLTSTDWARVERVFLLFFEFVEETLMSMPPITRMGSLEQVGGRKVPSLDLSCKFEVFPLLSHFATFSLSIFSNHSSIGWKSSLREWLRWREAWRSFRQLNQGTLIIEEAGRCQACTLRGRIVQLIVNGYRQTIKMDLIVV